MSRAGKGKALDAGLLPRVELICVGSELLAGRINTHQSYLALKLQAAGLSLARETSLPDDKSAIAREVRQALSRCDALLVCGGLGPTFDDLTREGAAAALGRKLLYRPSLYASIKKRFARYRLPVPEENKRQAFVIEGARVLANGSGSAPGQFIVLGRGASRQALALLPGPFAELAPMFESQVLPRLRRLYSRGLHTEHLCVRLSGIPESSADEKLSPLTEHPGPGERFTILASAGQVDFYASVTAARASSARDRLKALRRKIFEAVGSHVFGEGDDTLEAAVGKRLRAAGLTLSAAESCTGGLLGARLTAVAGSSDYFKGGVLAYSNDLKERLLGVKPSTLARHGAVSAACAREMAEGARRATGSSVAVAITGIAGPGGGTKSKPVGLVYIAFSGLGRRGELVKEFRFSGGRETVRQRSAAVALHILRKLIGRDPSGPAQMPRRRPSSLR